MKTFLEDLKTELVKMQVSEDKIQDILSDMEEMISSAKEEGISDEDLMAKLGDPKRLARELAEIEPKVEKPHEETNQDGVYAFDSIGETLSIRTKLTSDDVTYQSVDSNMIRVIIKDQKKDHKYNVTYENQTLTIDEGKMRTFFFGFSFGNGSSSIIIEIPKSITIESFKHNIVNGDVAIQSLAVSSLNINTTEGDIDMSSLIIQDGVIHTVNGDVKVFKSVAKMLRLDSVSGDVEIQNTEVEHDLTINTVSGDFEAKESSAENLYFHTVSGDGNGVEFYIKRLSFSSISGDFSLKNTRKEPIEILKKKSLSGDINL